MLRPKCHNALLWPWSKLCPPTQVVMQGSYIRSNITNAMLPAPSMRHSGPTFCVSPCLTTAAPRPCSASAGFVMNPPAMLLRHPLQPRQRCRATASTSPNVERESEVSAHSDRAGADADSKREQLKAQLQAAAGLRNGLDCSEAQRAAIGALVAELESLNPSSKPAGALADQQRRKLYGLCLVITPCSVGSYGNIMRRGSHACYTDLHCGAALIRCAPAGEWLSVREVMVMAVRPCCDASAVQSAQRTANLRCRGGPWGHPLAVAVQHGEGPQRGRAGPSQRRGHAGATVRSSASFCALLHTDACCCAENLSVPPHGPCHEKAD